MILYRVDDQVSVVLREVERAAKWKNAKLVTLCLGYLCSVGECV